MSFDMTAYNAKMEEIRRIKEDAKKLANEAIHAAVKDVFRAAPELLYFSWVQYVPAFNDGEPCEFTSTADYPRVVLASSPRADALKELRYNADTGYSWSPMCMYRVTDADTYDFDPDEFPADAWLLEEFCFHREKDVDWSSVPQESQDLLDALNGLRGVISGLDDDDREGIWGVHVRVVISPDGICTEDYDCGY